ncbi:hypothetical protein CBR_g42062 [Chara braunii]|uniref:Solute carrier family 40 member n=1 Tax=Chara braunii TaxID=69332 RepID=A0A388LWS3_CHABU|nr:hypothetical protein CBR_g42062 [Chara braunii]|eukprot:GBG86777.1 hypothetical protein CBR_g42062 [Chara braunii]
MDKVIVDQDAHGGHYSEVAGAERSMMCAPDGNSSPNAETAALLESGSGGMAADDKSKACYLLYCSHFLSRWGSRMWEFAVALFMVEILPRSLLLTAVYGLVEAGSVALFGMIVGRWVDSSPRLKAVQTSLVIQNASIIAASFAVGALLLDQHITGKSFLYVIATINLFGGIAALAGLGLNVAKEKDWVVVISSVQGEGMLARMNATMRRIDLSCLLLAPVAVGFLMSFLSMLSAAIAIATWNLVSFFLESYLLYRVYIAEPALALPRAVDSSIILKGDAAQIPSIDAGDDGLKRRNSRCGGCGITADVEHAAVDSGIGSCVQGHSTDNASAELNEPLLQGTRVSAAATGIRSPKPTLKADTNDSLKKLREGLRIYFRQPSLLPSLALACLYCTVLSFHSAMVAFLKLKNISPFTLSIVRGLAAVTGIMATVTFPCTSMQLHPSTTKCQGV